MATICSSSTLVGSLESQLQCTSSREVVQAKRALPTQFLGRMQVVARSSNRLAASRVVAVTAEKRDTEGQVSGSRSIQVAAFTAANSLLLALPALANEEKGAIFDFNLTLPIMAIQFLLLMVALDKIWYTPVGNLMDDRDAKIRAQLEGVRDNTAELKALQDEAEGIIKAARAETAIGANKMKKDLAAELDAKLQTSRSRMEKELAAALAALESQKVETLKNLDKQVEALSSQIVAKVLPFKI